jgi:parallel beta-helix repeat protein
VAAASLLATPFAEARTIEVKPGRETLQRAVDVADPGDRLKLKAGGVYRGGVFVEKRIEIKGPREGSLPRVDGRCREAFTILILGAKATLERLHVTGATDAAGSQYGGAEVNFTNGARGEAADLKIKESCSGTQYGINVFDSGDMRVTGSVLTGYLDAGVYVGGIRDPGTSIEVIGNSAKRGNHGVLIEDSLPEPVINVTDNTVTGNTVGPTSSGVYIRNSDGVVIERNASTGNGFAGIWLDQNSDFNELRGNTASGSGTADLQNDGGGNCGSQNSFGTEAGAPLGFC